MAIRELLGKFGNCFTHLWGIWLDLVSLLLTNLNGIQMHLNISCNYLLWHPMTSQGWLLYTYSIHISVMLQFWCPLMLIFACWLAILWVYLLYHLGSISTIQTKGIGRIDLEHGLFSDVLYLPYLAENLLSTYQMTHTREVKRVIFTPNML